MMRESAFSGSRRLALTRGLENRGPLNVSYSREHSGAYVEHETRFERATPGWPNGQSFVPANRSHSQPAAAPRLRLDSLFRWQRVAIVGFIDVYEVYRA